MYKKILSLIFAAFAIQTAALAIPGNSSGIKDISGDYVYYKDNSFNRESYVGILYYDDSTYQVRYYAPADAESSLPEKELSILLTVNPAADYWEFTGENIISTILPETEDTDLVNYLHDILYEFSSRRIKAGELRSGNAKNGFINSVTDGFGRKINTDYAQFGGDVFITFNSLIPVFNIEKITDAKDNPVLECVTIGKLNSSEDTGFTDFNGRFDFSASEKGSSLITKAKAKKVTYEKQTVTLDENWQQLMENLYYLDNGSMLAMAEIPGSEENLEDTVVILIRSLIQSSQNSYLDFRTLSLSYNSKAKQYRFTCNTVQPEKENTMFTVKLLTLNSSNGFSYFSVSSFYDCYIKNSTYFNNIIKSCKTN